MKKNLYYIVEKQLDDVDGFQETNGWKNIRVYEISDNKLIEVADFEVENTESSNVAILDNIEFEGFEIELIEL
jgi:hypothetical protein